MTALVRLGPGLLLALLAAGAAAAVTGAIAWRAGGLPLGAVLADRYVLSITLFTATQAALSTALSAVVGLMAARALARRPLLPGRRLLLLLAALSLVIPTTVAAAGIVAVWGRTGWVATSLAWLGLPGPDGALYGLPGILLAHVFFNAPLMARIFLAALEAVPEAHWRVAAQLAMRPADRFRIVEWPALRAVLPGAAGLVFLLCFTSFALILMLGGGPRSSTLEVAIYQAVRFDFDLGRAAVLALWQLAACGLALALLSRFPTAWGRGTAGQVAPFRPDADTAGARLVDGAALALAGVLFLLPLAAVLADGLAAAPLALFAAPEFRHSLAASLGLALASAGVTVPVALALAEARRSLTSPTRLGGRRAATLLAGGIDLAATVYLGVPAIVFGTGAFLLLSAAADLFALAPLLVLAANVLLSLPFALRAVQGRLATVAGRYDRLCAGLGITGFRRFRLVEWPLARREIGFAAALAAALSVGDLGVIALFGSDRFQTLPWLLYQKSGRYQSDEAAAIALALLVLSLLLFAVIERVVGGRHAAAR